MNEGIDIGQTEEGYSLTLPQTIVADPYAQNMYLGHWTIPDHLVEDGFGGIFVRRIE